MALVYGCCFWFSLRLGGILIGIFSLALVLLITHCLGYTNPQYMTNEIDSWTSGMDLIYAKDYLDSIKSDPQKFSSLGIILTCMYIIVTILFIYGAYTSNSVLMVTYILVELLRLILISILVATVLLLIKQNAMDIGLLIGASVAGGFLLLGMFYLWICAANLPIVIKEMENDSQIDMINKLKRLLDLNNESAVTHGLDNVPYTTASKDFINRGIFIMPRSNNLPIRRRSPGNLNQIKSRQQFKRI